MLQWLRCITGGLVITLLSETWLLWSFLGVNKFQSAVPWTNLVIYRWFIGIYNAYKYIQHRHIRRNLVKLFWKGNPGLKYVPGTPCFAPFCFFLVQINHKHIKAIYLTRTLTCFFFFKPWSMFESHALSHLTAQLFFSPWLLVDLSVGPAIGSLTMNLGTGWIKCPPSISLNVQWIRGSRPIAFFKILICKKEKSQIKVRIQKV